MLLTQPHTNPHTPKHTQTVVEGEVRDEEGCQRNIADKQTAKVEPVPDRTSSSKNTLNERARQEYF
jgi:hypothetical protein